MRYKLPLIALKTSILSLLVLFLTSSSYAFRVGDDPILSRLAAYNKLIESHHPEKVHIHTNQPVYSAGDTVWFKSYIINSYYSRPSALSKMLTVELVSKDGSIMFRSKLRTAAGLAWGNMPLPDTIQTGTYHIRAYTPGMKNFGETSYYDRSIVIRSQFGKPVSAPLSARSSIQFFPEGGDLIAGIRTKVAFKSIAPGGLSMEAAGSIVDGAGNLVTEFKSEHLGMGVFAMTALQGKNYYAQVRFKDGSETKQLIPQAKPEGYMMSVNNASDSIRVRVVCSPELADKGQLSLIGLQDGISKYASQFSLKQDIQNTVWIPKELFNSGTVQFTLFDPANNPVSERLTFVNRHDELLIQTSLKAGSGKREPVNLQFDLRNKAGERSIGNLSVSVYNESELAGNENDEVSIFSDLLLTADLKGFIESPNYYFSDLRDENRAKHLDHLLLTQGWRKFSWKNVLSQGLPQIAAPSSQSIEVSGRMMLPSGKPFIGGEVSLFRSGVPPMILQTKTDDSGNFRFSDLELIDTARLVISANNANYRKNMKIELFNIESSKTELLRSFPHLVPAKVISSPENARLNQFEAVKSAILLNSVSIEAQKINKVTESANLNGPGRADVVLTSNDIKNQHDMAVFLTSRVNGLKLYEGKVYNRDTPDKLMTEGPQPMLVVLDGVNIEQSNFNLGDINTEGIESVEVLKGASTTGIYGIEGSYGVLVITTKKGYDRSGNSLGMRTPGILPFTITGYQSNREFYSPKYEVSKTNVPVTPDLRKAVYWNPNISVGLSDKTEVNYFNSDYTGTYKIVVEGINADGQIGRAVYKYEVK